MYVDPARTRYWGDGINYGTFTFRGPAFPRRPEQSRYSRPCGLRQVDGAQLLTPPGQWLGLVVTSLQYNAICH